MAATLPRTSFSRLALYADCPLRYRYLEVEARAEPDVGPDWRRAPYAMLGVMAFDRFLGLAVHRALQGWQAGIDAGGPADPGALARGVEAEAAGLGAADPGRLHHALARLEPHLLAYARGPWPRRRTLALERPALLELPPRASDAALEVAIRVDRIAAIEGGAAILDFKTVSPHAAERRRDRWQLRTYALAAAALGLDPAARLRLVIVDVVGGRTLEVGAGRAALEAAERRLRACARGVRRGDFGVAGLPHRPCWSCGFRLTCPRSLAPAALPSPPV